MKNWIDYYFGFFRGRHILGSFGVAVPIYILGLCISFSIGFVDIYVKTMPIYLGVFGIIWVSFWAFWASKKIRSVFKVIRPSFLVDDKEFYQTIHLCLQRIYNIKWQLSLSSAIIFAGWIYIGLRATLSTIPWLPPSWSQGPYLWVKIIILNIYLIPIILLVTTTAFGIVTYARATTDIVRLPLIPFIEAAREKLHPVTDFGLIVGLAWSVGLSLFVIFFQPALDVGSIIFIAVITTFSLIVIFWPQYMLHKALDQTKQELINKGLHTLSAQIEENRQKETGILFEFLCKPNTQQISEFVKSVANSRTWIFNPNEVAVLLGTWILPFLSIAITKLFSE